MTEKAKSKTAGKDVIYVDADDEITAIIDKVRGSGDKIVALVLPKRAAVLQSVVNMKLLKRTADGSKKHVVLITSEASLLPLAGSVGVHVAKSLQSKPEVPDAPSKTDDHAEAIDDAGDDEDAVDKTRTVGELAGAAAVESELDDTIELDDEDDAPEGSGKGGKKDKKAASSSKGGKKFKIPNFNRFRVLLVLIIVGVILLGAGAYAALGTMPKAVIAIKTNSTTVNSNTIVTIKVGENIPIDLEQNIIPGKRQEVKKTLTEQVAATGQQNNGAQASGSVTIRNCTDSAITIPAGGGVNSNGLTYITQESLALAGGNFTSGGVCKTSGSHVDTVGVVSQQAGSKYNIAAGSTFAIAGYSSSVSGTGTAMTGGTDDIIKIVTQADIDNAAQKIGAQDTTGVKEQLKTDLTNQQVIPIEETFNAGPPETKTSVAAGAVATAVTVTQTITYTMMGAAEADFEKVIANDVESKIDSSKQTILDYGLDEATYLLQEQKPDGAVVNLQTVVVAGPDLDVEEIKKQVAGMKSGAAESLIKKYPGVTEVSVEYSPFWVSSIPEKTSKITITVEEPQAAEESSDDDAQSPASP